MGPLRLRNRFMMPPHGLIVGNPFGGEEEIQRGLEYYGRRANDVAMICALNGFVDNSILPPGFEPTGQGTRLQGMFRRPEFQERAGRVARVIQRSEERRVGRCGSYKRRG